MGKLLNIVGSLHKSNRRNYLERMNSEKTNCMEVSRKYDFNYWDGERKYGYGGYKYDGRWSEVAKKLIEQYNLKEKSAILDIGCGKGYLLYEIKKLIPPLKIHGADISEYAINKSKKEIRDRLCIRPAQEKYPQEDNYYDLALSINTLHNLTIEDLLKALAELQRIARNKYVVVESYRNVKELFNLQCWALTCESFFRPKEWKWIFKTAEYTGDYEFIFFE